MRVQHLVSLVPSSAVDRIQRLGFSPIGELGAELYKSIVHRCTTIGNCSLVYTSAFQKGAEATPVQRPKRHRTVLPKTSCTHDKPGNLGLHSHRHGSRGFT